MAKAKAKTTETATSVSDFVKTIPDKERQKDCLAIIKIMKEQSGFEPKMWGPAIIGFGSYHYKYESGHEGSAPLVGIASRANAITLYLGSAFDNREALLTKFTGPKIVIAEGECQLNRQRRVAPAIKKMVSDGHRVVRERFGIDADVCTGDHSCIRLSGCPSLTVKSNPDPLRRDPVAYVDNSCVGCGVCGEVAHAAVLCPSFYRADVIVNPTAWDRLKARVRSAVISLLA